ncbi:MAG: RHS repeat domain-containing protein [Alcanivoracaceae bacterium]
MHHYTLDELHRLTAAAYQYNEQLQQQAQLLLDEHYSYDGVGNRLTDSTDAHGGSWQYNVNHQLTERPEYVYTYDANGHTLSKTETGTGIVTQFQYDITERLTAVSKTDQNGTTPLGQYRYDPFGRRVRKVSQSETLYFHYDDTGLLAEYDAQGNLVREYQYTPGSTWMTKPLFLRDVQTGKVHYYYNSHLGQPLKLFDRQGRTTWEARSQAFGELLVVVEEVENRLRFPGQYFDGETGLYHNYHRDYGAGTGRYFQRDPLGIYGEFSFFNYARSNPLTYVDWLGLRAKGPGSKGVGHLPVGECDYDVCMTTCLSQYVHTSHCQIKCVDKLTCHPDEPDLPRNPDDGRKNDDPICDPRWTQCKCEQFKRWRKGDVDQDEPTCGCRKSELEPSRRLA